MWEIEVTFEHLGNTRHDFSLDVSMQFLGTKRKVSKYLTVSQWILQSKYYPRFNCRNHSSRMAILSQSPKK